VVLRQRHLACRARAKVPLRDPAIALKDIKAEVELGYDRELAFKEAQRCLNCDVQTVFKAPLCIECDACVDICPVDCITFTQDGEEGELRTRLKAPALNPAQALYVQDGLKTGRVMAKDEDVCLHCGMCAERCPTGAWDMQKFLLEAAKTVLPPAMGGVPAMPRPITATNDFVVKFANVNGSGSASANQIFARSILRMGVPIASRNIFPSNIQACPPGTRCGSRKRAICGGAAASISWSP
jgi:ferredoxin